jgi:hypothetical protein
MDSRLRGNDDLTKCSGAFIGYWVGSLIAIFTVASATERSLPGAPGQRTVVASRHRFTPMVATVPSMSGVVPGGV